MIVIFTDGCCLDFLCTAALSLYLTQTFHSIWFVQMDTQVKDKVHKRCTPEDGTAAVAYD